MGFFSFLGDLVGSIGSALFGGETGRIVSSVGNEIGAQAAANDQNRYISSANDASRRFALDMYNLQPNLNLLLHQNYQLTLQLFLFHQ